MALGLWGGWKLKGIWKEYLEIVKELEKATGEGKRKNVLCKTGRKSPCYAIAENLATVFLLAIRMMYVNDISKNSIESAT